MLPLGGTGRRPKGAPLNKAPDRYAVLGNPVAHSQSPFIHAEFARQTGEKLSYGRLLCPLDGFAHTLQDFAASQAGGPARGCNVTVPFKFEAFRMCQRTSARATLAGAVRTRDIGGTASTTRRSLARRWGRKWTRSATRWI